MSGRPAPRSLNHRDPRGGFTLIEVMITLLVLGIAMLGLTLVLRGSASSGGETMNNIEARTMASTALDLIARDLRAAGSGADAGYATPQTAIAYVDSLELMLCADISGAATAPVDTLAYAPGGSPKPYKLTGAYAPPIKYRTGAELIRWTLDLDNDGLVDANDVSAANGVDVQRTPNPNDYTLVRQIYGDSLSDVANDNGGAVGRIALIRAPGAGIPPLYTVTFTDGTTWSWSSGAVPANRLKDIASIAVQITAESGRADSKHRYARVSLGTTVSLGRIGS